jgi:hypothetical protein
MFPVRLSTDQTGGPPRSLGTRPRAARARARHVRRSELSGGPADFTPVGWHDRSAPHGRGDADRVAADAVRLPHGLGDWRHDLVGQERVWGQAIHRVAAEGISPEQAVDEAIARIKQILSE